MRNSTLSSLTGVQLLAIAVLQPKRRPHVSRVLNSNAKRFGIDNATKSRKIAA